MNKLIAISAGHYPNKPGACHEGFCEYDEAQRWADYLVALLGPGNAVRVPGTPLRDKVEFIKARDCALAVEIHFNAFQVWKDKNGNGIKDIDEMVNVGRGSLTYYYPGSEEGKALAVQCQEILGALFPPNHGAKEGWYRMDPKNGPIFFLEKTPCPAVLIEPEFLHNKALIQANREEACKQLAVLFLNYVNKDG